MMLVPELKHWQGGTLKDLGLPEEGESWEGSIG